MIISVICGGLGGIAPPLFYLAIGLVYKGQTMPSLSYWFGILLFFAIGVGVAFVFKETVRRKAFLLGIGLPAMLNGAISEATQVSLPATSEPRASIVGFAISSANAQEPAATANNEQKLVIQPNKNLSPYKVWFLQSDGSVIATTNINNPNKSNSVTVPKGTTQLWFESPDFSGAAKSEPLESVEQNIELNLKPQFWSGFLQALGVENVKKYKAEVQPATQ